MTPTNRHPWFAPLYRRIAIVVVCLVWLALEVLSGERLWLIASAAITAYAVWALLLSYKQPEDNKDCSK